MVFKIKCLDSGPRPGPGHDLVDQVLAAGRSERMGGHMGAGTRSGEAGGKKRKDKVHPSGALFLSTIVGNER